MLIAKVLTGEKKFSLQIFHMQMFILFGLTYLSFTLLRCLFRLCHLPVEDFISSSSGNENPIY